MIKVLEQKALSPTELAQIAQLKKDLEITKQTITSQEALITALKKTITVLNRGIIEQIRTTENLAQVEVPPKS